MNRADSRGYTLTELVLVLVIAGVIAAFALPRFFDVQVFQQRGFFESALAAARFAQKHAVATGCNIRVQFSAAGFSLSANSSLASCSATTFGSAVTNPAGGGNFGESAPPGITVSTADLYFDGAGRPRSPATGALLAAPVSVTIGVRTLRIERESGYAHAL